MKRTMKLFSTFASILIAASIFAGCKNNNDDDEEAGNRATNITIKPDTNSSVNFNDSETGTVAAATTRNFVIEADGYLSSGYFGYCTDPQFDTDVFNLAIQNMIEKKYKTKTFSVTCTPLYDGKVKAYLFLKSSVDTTKASASLVIYANCSGTGMNDPYGSETTSATVSHTVTSGSASAVDGGNVYTITFIGNTTIELTIVTNYPQLDSVKKLGDGQWTYGVTVDKNTFKSGVPYKIPITYKGESDSEDEFTILDKRIVLIGKKKE